MDNAVPAGLPLSCSRICAALALPLLLRSAAVAGQSHKPPGAGKNWGRAMLQSHAGESESSALRQGESSGTQSVIFKEHFGGQEASGEEQREGGRGSLLNTSTSLHTSSSSQNSTLRSTEAV